MAIYRAHIPVTFEADGQKHADVLLDAMMDGVVAVLGARPHESFVTGCKAEQLAGKEAVIARIDLIDCRRNDDGELSESDAEEMEYFEDTLKRMEKVDA